MAYVFRRPRERQFRPKRIAYTPSLYKVIEAASAADSVNDILIILGSVAESGAATSVADTPAAALAGSVAESGAAADFPDTPVAVHETGTAADASFEFLTVIRSASETGSAVDSTSALRERPAIIMLTAIYEMSRNLSGMARVS